MRTKKSLLAMMMATACLFSAAVPMNAGATTNCDLNGDGDVNVLDVIVINRYLNGAFYVSDPSVMDTNGNMIIDFADSDYVMAVASGLPYSCEFLDIS